jgi:hypothetical protein
MVRRRASFERPVGAGSCSNVVYSDSIVAHVRIPDLLFLLNIQPEAVQVTVHNPLTMSTAKNVIILVTILHLEMQVTENLAIKLFADFAAGLVEVSVPATIETQSKVAAQCKIKPMAFGSCMCLNSKKTLWIVKCMAVYPFAGVSISEIESQNVDLQWPLEDLIRSVFLMLESLAATDPLARTHMCFYHRFWKLLFRMDQRRQRQRRILPFHHAKVAL